jgi:nitrate reductase NapE component
MSAATPATRRELGALLFMNSAMTTLDAYSTLESSPWTAENFGADEAKAKSCREYMVHAVCFSMVYAVVASIIAESMWPVLGAVVSNGYLIWLYQRALNRAVSAGSSGWAKGEG